MLLLSMGLLIHGILEFFLDSQANILEWVAISFFRRSSQPWDGTCVSSSADRLFSTDPAGKPQIKDILYPKL